MQGQKCKQESSGSVYKLSIIIEPEELDPVYKHLHHAKALLLLEQARLAFLERIGFSSASLIAKDLYPVIVSINVRYRREIGAGPVEVTCEQCSVDRVLLRIRQRILTRRGKAALDAQVDSALMCGETKSAVEPSAEFISAFSSFDPTRLSQRPSATEA